MYCPALFREDRIDVLHAFIREHPLGLVISNSSSGLLANLLPFELHADESGASVLKAHMARANPQWRDIDGQTVLVVFRGADAYISPSLYATKKETGKVVPTWNYAMVQARGTARLRDQHQWLAHQLEALTSGREAARPHPWSISDAPVDYVEAQMKNIVGIDIEVASLEGKWKVSQNQPEANRRTVAAGLATDDGTQEMAAIVRAYGNID